jgi:hypothetical protein
MPEIVRRDSWHSCSLHGPCEPAHVVVVHACSAEMGHVVTGEHQIFAPIPVALLCQTLSEEATDPRL